MLPLRERLASLEEEGLGRISRIEFAAVAAIAEMELAGVKLDVARWKELEVRVRERRDRAADHLESFFPPPEGILPLEGLGPRLNLNSPKQITDAFRTLGIELPDTKVWTLLKVDHPAAKALLEYRELQKKLGTYLETYPGFISPKTGRIHANFLSAAYRLGVSPAQLRISSRYRTRTSSAAALWPKCGNTLVIADYSQIELRILAEVSEDPPSSGLSREAWTSTALRRPRCTTCPWMGSTKDQRTAAKRINFGLMYGRGAEQSLRPARHGRGTWSPAHRRVLRQLPQSATLLATNGQPGHAGPHTPTRSQVGYASSATTPWPTTGAPCAGGHEL